MKRRSAPEPTKFQSLGMPRKMTRRSRPAPPQHVLFGDEAEEASRTPSTSSRSAFTRQRPRLFGDEEEEQPVSGPGGPGCEFSSATWTAFL